MPTDPHLDVPEAVRVQILATEHWSLLAARNITYGAIYSRATIFLTVVSAAVVALALAAEATEFGERFYVFALLVLPVAFFIGVGTYIRLVDARIEDYWLQSGLNRLRHAYLEIAPYVMLLVASRLQCSVARICTRTASGTSVRGAEGGSCRPRIYRLFADGSVSPIYEAATGRPIGARLELG